MKSKQVYVESLIADFPLGGINTGDNIGDLTVYEVFEKLLTGTLLSSTLTVEGFSNVTNIIFTGATVAELSPGEIRVIIDDSITESDPIFTASAAYGITNLQINHWDDAYSWGNHADGNYVISTNTYDNPSWLNTLAYSKITSVPDFVLTSTKGSPNGVAPLNSSGLIDSTYLPSYVDDVIEVSNFAALPTTGEQGKIYVTVNNGNGYRWSGSMYIQIFTSGGGGGASAFTELTDVPSSYTGESLKVVRVKSDETGLEFATISGSSQTLADTLTLGNESTGNDIILTTGDKIWFGDPITSKVYMNSPSDTTWTLYGENPADALHNSQITLTYDQITFTRTKASGEYATLNLADPLTASDPQVILEAGQGGASFAMAVKKDGIWFGTAYNTLVGPTAGYVVAQKADNSGLEYVDPSTFGGGSMVYPGAGIAVSDGSAWITSITDNSTDWNTAYGWGDHSIAGYLTANQSITLSGDITGSGATSITTTIANGAVDIGMLSATGTPSASTFLRGDNTWASATGSGVTSMGTIGSSPNSDGATISGTTLTLQPADATNGGIVIFGTQTFGGQKTFNNITTFSLAGTAGTAMVFSGNGDTTNASVKFTGGTIRWIDFSTGGSGVAPSLASRSAGSRIVLANTFTSGSLADFAIGMTSNSIWFSCGNNAGIYGFEWYGGSTLAMTLKGNGLLTLTNTLNLKAGTTTIGPLKFSSGTNLTTAVAGTMEYNGTNLFFTRSGTTREGILTQSAVTTEVIVSDTSVTVNINGTTYKLLARA